MSTELPDSIRQAFYDWNQRRAYIDNNGNYRVKAENSPNGPIAPWNKEVKRIFASCTEFHTAAQTSKGESQ